VEGPDGGVYLSYSGKDDNGNYIFAARIGKDTRALWWYSIVEGLLIPGSNLYQSQKNLVVNLNKQKIREKLLDYQVKDVQIGDHEGIYKVYVHEKIGIQYPDKPGLKVLEVDWIYTVETQWEKLGLSGSEKWVRN
jgi:hypothetical protein